MGGHNRIDKNNRMGRNKIRNHKTDLQKRSCSVIMHMNQLLFTGYLIYENIVYRTEKKNAFFKENEI